MKENWRTGTEEEKKITNLNNRTCQERDESRGAILMTLCLLKWFASNTSPFP